MKDFLRVAAALSIISGVCAFNASVKFNTTNQYCIVLNADHINGVITYHDLNEGEKTYKFSAKDALEIFGKCSDVSDKKTTEYITVGFYPDEIIPTPVARPWELTIVFKENTEQVNNAYKIASYNLTVYLYDNIFPNVTQRDLFFAEDPTAEMEWHGEKTNGFKCSDSGLAFTNGTSINFKDLKVVAFGLLSSDVLDKTQDYALCKLDSRTSDVVPVVVGACLAGLVIIVLIAYLIGRARAKRQGYASV